MHRTNRAPACAVILATVISLSHAQTPYVLFTGNSISYSRGGVDTSMMAISNMMGDSIVADHIWRGSSSAISIWDDFHVLDSIQAKSYTHVVLQPYVGDMSSIRSFITSCDTIVPQIQAEGARVVLYLSWPFQASVPTWDSTALLAVYDSLSAAWDVDYVPVGPSLVWWHTVTAIRMYDDHAHPSPMAQYLAGTFFYTYLAQKPAVGNDVREAYELGSLQAQKMHDQAAETLLGTGVVCPRARDRRRTTPLASVLTEPGRYILDLRGRPAGPNASAGLRVGADGAMRATIQW